MRYHIITIEREYGSGGTEIGQRLAKELGIPCYGKEILERVAAERGTTAEQLAHMEEKATGSFLYTLAMATNIATGVSDGLSEESGLYLAEGKVIKEMATEGPCIIVGRCAGWILRDRKDILNVFVHADPDYRKKRAVEVYGDSENKVDNLLKRCDRRRNSFYGANTGKCWDDKSGYQLMLDSSKLGIERCVDIISSAVR